MGRYLKIIHTPNESGHPQYTVVVDEGGLSEKTTATNDQLEVIKAVAAFLSEGEK